MPGWPGNTVARRAAKRVLAPVLNERTYSYVQALSMARDIRSGALSEPEIDLIPRFVKPGDAVVDVGANYGMWVLPLSRAVGPGGHVWAFEPIPFTVDTLRKVTALLRLKNVEVVSKGCSDSAGSITFDVPMQDNGAISGGQAHFADRNDDRPGRERHARWTQSRQISCEVVALDEVIPESQHVSLIKLDIEGAELAALRGAHRILERDHPAIVLEINPWFLEGLGLSVRDLTSFARHQGYALHRWSDAQLPAVDDADVVEGNYVFLSPDSSTSSA